MQEKGLLFRHLRTGKPKQKLPNPIDVDSYHQPKHTLTQQCASTEATRRLLLRLPH